MELTLNKIPTYQQSFSIQSISPTNTIYKHHFSLSVQLILPTRPGVRATH